MKSRVLAPALFGSLVAFALSARPAHASGFQLDTQSARGIGMGNAMTGFDDDSSAIFYNAAGIAQGKFIDAQANADLFLTGYTFTDTRGVSTTSPLGTIPLFQAYVSGGITDDFSIGIGVFTPYGLTLKWPAGWEGRSLITYAQLATYDINPTIAYRLGPLRIGGGVQIVPATIDLQRDIALPNGQYGSTELGATAYGIGGNIGIQVEAIPRVLMFGAHYRSAVELPFDGNVHFSNIPQILQGTLHDQPASSRFVLPDQFAFGAAVHPVKNLVLDLDVTYVGWHFLRSIDINFPQDQTGTLSSSQPKNWSSMVKFNLGGELAMGEQWRIRAGLIVDPTAAPADTLTPELPDSTRISFCIGAGYHHRSGLRIDLANQFVLSTERTSTAPQLPGDYRGWADILAVGFGFASTPPSQVP